MTLRLLCKLQEPEILEPLVPSCRLCLTHRVAYVRKNAIFAIMTIYKNFEHLIPDAPEIISTLLMTEADPECKRNAFLMLCNTDNARALAYLSSVFSQIAALDELMQLAIIELIRKDCRTNLAAKGNYVRCIVSLLTAPSRAVKYEAATTLPSLTSSPMAIREVAACYIDLAMKEPDNNIKLIVLDQMNALREKNSKVLNEMAMDVLRVVASPDIAVSRKAAQIAMEMLSLRNVHDVVAFLKKEITKTYDPTNEKNSDYRQLLIHSVHTCAIKFPEVAADVVHVLMEFLTDSGTVGNTSAVDVITFVREAVELNSALRPEIVSKLLQNFCQIKSGRVMRGAVWIVGEYCLDMDSIVAAMKEIRAGLGELPIVASEQKILDEVAAAAQEPEKSASETATVSPVRAAPKPKRVLADGTYATESAFASSSKAPVEAAKTGKERPPVRNLIMNGDYFLATVLATALTKLVLRVNTLCKDAAKKNYIRAEAMLIMTSIIRVGQSTHVTIPLDEDSYDRIVACLRVLANTGDNVLSDVFTKLCRSLYGELVHNHEKKAAALKSKLNPIAKVGVDDVLVFKQLKTKNADGHLVDEYDADIMKATGATDYKNVTTNRLNRIVQLSGFSDPVYAEAYVDVHQYDILLDILIVNQTSETLQNLTVEFATLGDLKLVERPASCSMGPHSFHSIKANIKVSSTETGVIFGNIVYDGAGIGDSHAIVLNDIHIDIMDYINPAQCDENEFRNMWTEFEWENKIVVNTNITDLRKYLQHVMKNTNMACLTPDQALSGDCRFMSANMYAKSIFGEDALANISLELMTPNSPVTGHIRIRSKTQGIALSLGDKITLTQKEKM